MKMGDPKSYKRLCHYVTGLYATGKKAPQSKNVAAIVNTIVMQDRARLENVCDGLVPRSQKCRFRRNSERF